jgi:hypothetical protein
VGKQLRGLLMGPIEHAHDGGDSPATSRR